VLPESAGFGKKGMGLDWQRVMMLAESAGRKEY